MNAKLEQTQRKIDSGQPTRHWSSVQPNKVRAGRRDKRGKRAGNRVLYRADGALAGVENAVGICVAATRILGRDQQWQQRCQE
jgi:hypothetical protein